jgi:hypothetical protein
MDGLLEFLERDDANSRSARATRVRELLELFPIPENGMLLFGGELVHRGIVEARLAYVSGLYFSCILTSLGVMGQYIAAFLYARGDDSARRMTSEKLFENAETIGLILPNERTEFDRFRKLRNSYAHFREISHPENLMRRAIRAESDCEEILQNDAKEALRLLGAYFNRAAAPSVSLVSP